MGRIFIILTFGVLLYQQSGPAMAASTPVDGVGGVDLVGKVEVVDGDTLLVGGKKVRLYGIDAPETDQYCATKHDKAFHCGRLATRALRLFLSGADVHCKIRRQLQNGMVLANCYAGRNDLSAQMATAGWALADPDTGADYRRGELAARATKEGLFKGNLLPPWEWRAGKREIAPGLPWDDAAKARK